MGWSFLNWCSIEMLTCLLGLALYNLSCFVTQAVYSFTWNATMSQEIKLLLQGKYFSKVQLRYWNLDITCYSVLRKDPLSVSLIVGNIFYQHITSCHPDSLTCSCQNLKYGLFGFFHGVLQILHKRSLNNQTVVNSSLNGQHTFCTGTVSVRMWS